MGVLRDLLEWDDVLLGVFGRGCDAPNAASSAATRVGTTAAASALRLTIGVGGAFRVDAIRVAADALVAAEHADGA